MPSPHPTPDEIWDAATVEGGRRVGRSLSAIAAAAFVGGTDVMVGVAAVVSVAGRLANVTDDQTADMLGALVFGIGFVMLELARLCGVVLALNLLAVALIAWMLSVEKVLDEGSLHAAGRLADLHAARSSGAAFLSAVLAGPS